MLVHLVIIINIAFAKHAVIDMFNLIENFIEMSLLNDTYNRNLNCVL
jgi:hypothetical protein